MEGSDGGRASWIYREQTESSSCTISSSVGTVSTGFTSASRLSWTSMEAARHLEEIEEEDWDSFVQPVKKLCLELKLSSEERPSEMEQNKMLEPSEMEPNKMLVKEFFRMKSSIGGGDMSSVLERWFTELGVGWILHLPVADGAPEEKLEHTDLGPVRQPAAISHQPSASSTFLSHQPSAISHQPAASSQLAVLFSQHQPAASSGFHQPNRALDASTWMPALREMVNTFRLTMEANSRSGGDIRDQIQTASFTQQAMLKMLCFIDVIVAGNHNVISYSSMSLVGPYRKLHILLRVRDALFGARIQLSHYDPPTARVGRIHDDTISVLSVKEGKADEAIWSAMQENRNRIMESADDLSGTQTRQVSSDIHEATQSLMEYMMFLQQNFWSVTPIVSEAASLGKYLPQIGHVNPLTSLAEEMVSCLREKLANMSEKFRDQSLGFLFMINNLSFIRDKIRLTPYVFESYEESIAGEVEAYMERYMQVSWAPVLSCLSNPTRVCFGKIYSPLSKFESKFHETYATQKLWKVPDPKLKKTLRKAIADKMVPAYTKYIEDNSVATPKFTPQNLQEMLQELFEG